MLLLAAFGKTRLSHDILFNFSVGPFELFEVESQKKVEFWDLNAEVWYLQKMYGFSPRKGKAALCATYGSKVMI